MTYRPRIVDQELARRLAATGAVVVEGPKACGKTETARRQAASELRVDVDVRVAAAMDVDPGLLLDGETPRLLDEWQVRPDLWNHVRRAVDDRGRPGQFILTGSATPADDASRHSGAGRFGRLRMRPMSLAESGDSSGEVSLRGLFDGDPVRVHGADIPVDRVAQVVARGGWPALVGMASTDAAEANRDYLTTIQQVDLRRVAGARRDPVRLERVMRAIARHTATEASVSTILADASGPDGTLARNTVDDYLDVLRRLMILDEQPAWSTHLRSSASLRRTPKRHLADPSLAAAAMRATPATLVADLNALGQLFESLVVRDLRVYSQPLGGTVSHYRDSSGLEVDAIVGLDDGRWGAVEVKLGAGSVDQAAGTLLKFADVVDTDRGGRPAFLAVVTASGLGYRRPDGVAVVPAAALGA